MDKEEEQQDDGMVVRMKGKATIEARVFRAATGEWEDLGVVAEIEGEE